MALLTLPNTLAGVWDRGQSVIGTGPEFGYLVGLTFQARWAEVEPAPGVFAWDRLDDALLLAERLDTYIYISINVGPDAPGWIYNDVPRVTTDADTSKFVAYPLYTAPAYFGHYARLVRACATHVRRRSVAFVQVKTGCTGDEVPYKGTPRDAAHAIDTDAWAAFRLRAFALFVDAFQAPDTQHVPLLYNGVGRGGTADWLRVHQPRGFGVKLAGMGRGHHLHGERQQIEAWHPRLLGAGDVFARSEMDKTWRHPYFQRNVVLGFFWAAMTALTAGLTVWDVTASALLAADHDGFSAALRMFTRYARHRRADTARRAFCALHKGLDAGDTAVYPEAEFGPLGARAERVARAHRIQQAYAHLGAAIDDPETLTVGQVRQRREQVGYNDVGYGIWPHNYGRFLEQVDPDETSLPVWRVGCPGGHIGATAAPYARFARRLDRATGRNKITLRPAAAFGAWAGAASRIAIDVTWYDDLPDAEWTLSAHALDAGVLGATAIVGLAEPPQWRRQRLVVTAVPPGTRLGAVVLAGEGNTVFSLVEVRQYAV